MYSIIKTLQYYFLLSFHFNLVKGGRWYPREGDDGIVLVETWWIFKAVMSKMSFRELDWQACCSFRSYYQLSAIYFINRKWRAWWIKTFSSACLKRTHTHAHTFRRELALSRLEKNVVHVRTTRFFSHSSFIVLLFFILVILISFLVMPQYQADAFKSISTGRDRVGGQSLRMKSCLWDEFWHVHDASFFRHIKYNKKIE